MRNPAIAKSTKKANGAVSWPRAKTRNGKSRNGSNGEAVREIERFLEHKQWSKARAAIQECLVFHPTDHWLWMHLGLTYFEQKKYEQALKCCEHALRLASECPLAKWHYAGCLSMVGRDQEALTMWQTLLDADVEEIAHGQHGEGMDWALQLVNDVHFRMGSCRQALKEWDAAQESLQKYVHNRQHGVGSLYELKTALRRLEQIAKHLTATHV